MTDMDRPGGKDMPCASGITTKTIGREVRSFVSLPSTSTLAMELASKGCREGLVVLAESQTAGRGRNGRTFSSPEGGLYMSVVLRPPREADRLTVLPLIFGLSVSKALSCASRVVTELKWPNDVLVEGRKVCGILNEMTTSGKRVEHLVVGIGINVNSKVKDLPADLSEKATTLLEATGRPVDINELVRSLLYFMDLHYSRFLDGQIEGLLEEWSERSSTLRRRVRVIGPLGPFEGTALGIDQTGALLVKTEEGIQRIVSGDCEHI